MVEKKHRKIKFSQSFSYKIVLLCAAVTILFIVSTALFYRYVTAYIEKEIQYNSEFIVEQLRKNVESSFDKLNARIFSPYALDMLFSKTVGKSISAYEKSAYPNIIRSMDIKSALDEFLYTTHHANWVAVVDSEQIVYTSSKYKAPIPYDIKGNIEKDRNTTASLHGQVCWKNCDDGSLILQRVLYNLGSMQQCGYVIANISKEAIMPIFDSIASDKSGDFILFDGDLQPLLETAAPITAIVQTYLARSPESRNGQFTITTNDGDYILSLRGLYNNRVFLAHIVNMSQKQKQFYQIAEFLIIMGTSVLALILGLLLLFFKTTYRKIDIILDGIESTSTGNFHHQIAVTSNDEFGIIASQINIMVNKIEDLMLTITGKEQERQLIRYQMLEFRYNALQAQINPHFLFNALESINGIAKINNDTKVSQLVCRLALLFRCSIDRTGKFCKLSSEIDYVDNYLTLYREMYPDKLAIEYQIEPCVSAVQIPTFILQPIVENAIVHGIERKVNFGHIFIGAKKQENHLILTVRDDGGGINPERLAEISNMLNHGCSRAKPQRVGITNVQDRIELIYGKGYGLQIQTEPGFFTEVRIILPIKSREEASDVSSYCN